MNSPSSKASGNLTTTVGSYPIPDWLAAFPSEHRILPGPRSVSVILLLRLDEVETRPVRVDCLRELVLENAEVFVSP